MATASASDRDLECPVCQEPFRTPKMLPCGHTLCLEPCLEQVSMNKPSVRCPECREQHTIPDGGIEKFPNNIFVIRLMSSAKPKVEQTRSAVCPTCDNEQVLLKCFHCRVLVCEKCRVSHTEDLRQTTDSVLIQLNGISDTCNLNDLQEKAKVILSDKVNAMHDTVDAAFESLRIHMEERKACLKWEIQQYSKDELKVIELKAEVLESQMNENKQFGGKNNTSSIIQSELLEVQYDSQKRIDTTTKYIDDFMSVTGVSIKVENDDILGAIKNFCKVAKIDNKLEDVSDVMPDIRSREPPQEPVVVQRPIAPLLREREIGKVKKCIGREGKEPGLFHNPRAVAVSPVTGNVVVADTRNKRIQICDPEGNNPSCVSFENGTGWLTDIVIDEDGQIFALENSIQIHVLNEDGQTVRVIKAIRAISLAIDSRQRLHVCCGKDNIFVYGRNGEIVTSYGTGVDLKSEFQSITIDHNDDTIYILNRPDQVLQYNMHIFNKDMQFMRCVTLNNLSISVMNWNGFKLAQDVFLFADRLGGKIKMLDRDFNFIKSFGVKGQGVGQLYEPSGLDLTLTGDIVVVGGNNYLQYF